MHRSLQLHLSICQDLCCVLHDASGNFCCFLCWDRTITLKKVLWGIAPFSLLLLILTSCWCFALFWFIVTDHRFSLCSLQWCLNCRHKFIRNKFIRKIISILGLPLNNFATWCIPLIQSAPWRNQGVVF